MQTGLLREKKAEEKAVVRAASADKKRGVAKTILAASVVVALAGALAVWFFKVGGTHNHNVVVAGDRVGRVVFNGDIKGRQHRPRRPGRRRRTGAAPASRAARASRTSTMAITSR